MTKAAPSPAVQPRGKRGGATKSKSSKPRLSPMESDWTPNQGVFQRDPDLRGIFERANDESGYPRYRLTEHAAGERVTLETYAMNGRKPAVKELRWPGEREALMIHVQQDAAQFKITKACAVKNAAIQNVPSALIRLSPVELDGLCQVLQNHLTAVTPEEQHRSALHAIMGRLKDERMLFEALGLLPRELN